MTYDYFGNWDKETGHVAPMYAHSEVSNVFFNTNFTLNYWIELGASPSKIIMGLPMYGQSFTLEDPQVNGLNAKSKGPGEAGEFTRQGGFLAFYEVCNNIILKSTSLFSLQMFCFKRIDLSTNETRWMDRGSRSRGSNGTIRLQK